jgi:Spy/CpxP family protein refolding chaperone
MHLRFFAGIAVAGALAASATAQSPAPRPPPPAQPVAPQTYAFPTTIHQMNDVNKSLNLTDKQIEQLNKVTTQTQEHYRPNYEKLGNLTEGERWAKTQELHRQYNTEWTKGARDVLDDNQLNRYQQLQWQYGGYNSLYDPDVQKQLQLTEEQQRGLRREIDWSNQQMQDINKLGATDSEKAMQAHRDYRKQYDERWNKYLTPEQHKTWTKMTGEAYQFQPPLQPRK